MKKLFVISSVIAALAATSANAKDGAYVGFDVLASNVKNKYQDRTDHTNSSNGSKIDHDALGFGLNAGYKMGVGGNVFVAPEVFFDYLANSSKTALRGQYEGSNNDRFRVNNRYGAKLNLGYDFTKEFSASVNVGLANTQYTYDVGSFGLSRGSSELGAVYGLGTAYNINDNWSLRFGLDRQKLNVRGVFEGERYKVTIHTARLGLAYNF
jgi:outer membrane autotransporter protein